MKGTETDMKKMTQKLLALFLGIAMLSSCVTESAPGETAETEETAETTVSAPVTNGLETGEPSRVLPAESEVLSLEPRELNGNLIKTDSTFRIKTRSDMEAEALSALLSVEPSRPIRVTKNGERDYTLDVGTLPKGEIVKVTLGDGNGNTVDSWGFQTEDEFRVLSAFPADKSDYVPTDSGIEIALSYPADAAKVGSYFEITPPVSGRFASYSSTLAFIPNDGLAKKTVYTVTLKKGLPSSDGTELSEDYTFSFRTQEGDLDSFCYAVNGFSETYLPDDPIVIDVFHSPLFLNREFDFKLYQYRNGEDYGNAIRDYYENTSWAGEYEIPTDGLPVVMDEKLPLYHSEKKQSYYRGEISSFVLPDNLEEGYYLAEFSTELDGETFLIRCLIQISPISVYAGVLSGQAMFFVNDTDSGNAAENAEITFTVGGSDYSAKIGRNGTALLDYSAGEADRFDEGMTTEGYMEDGYPEADADRAGLLRIEYGGRVFYDRLNCVSDRELTPEEKYYMYLFTDRSAYLTSDTIEVWGVIRPRKAGEAVPENLTLKLGESLSDGIVTDVTLSPDGTFTGKFTYERLAEKWWSPISLCDGETELCSVNVRITDYEKPIYTLDPVLPEYVWMPQENGVTAGINIAYYDGTPAEGKEVQIGDNGSQITDKNGYAESVVRMNSREYPYAQPDEPWQYFGANYELSGIENEYLTAHGSTIAFIRDVGLDVKETRADDLSISLDLNAYQVDIENLRIENGEYYAYPVPESYHGAPADLTVTAKVTRRWYEKTESGSYYDFIQKKNFPIIEYVDKEETVGSYTAEVRNGVGSFQNLPTTDPDSGYTIDLTWEDSQGRAMSKYIYDSGSFWYHPETDVLTYDLFLERDADFTYSAALGETRSVTLRENSAALSPRDFKGRIFYAIYQDKALFTDVSAQPSFTFTMKEEYIPSFYLTAAYFDGKHIFPLEYDKFLSFSPEERRIDLELRTDRESYAPAETAEVTLTAKTKDGKPVPNARILLSVVDEAAFAVAEQTAQPLEQLYRSVYYPMADSYVSYIQHTMYAVLNGGGKGGGDPEAVRRKFLDTAYFTEGVSDANGRLTLSVELPDNVTSWRFTALAVGEYDGGRLYAGTTRKNLSATLPLFITPIMLSEYVEGDEIVFSAVAAGDLNAEITAEVNGADFSEALSADEDGEFDFGRLPVGEYTVLFRAKSDQGSDAAEYPFRVVKARLTTRVEKDFDLTDEAIDITPAFYPVRVTFYNKETVLFNEVLGVLQSHRGTNLDDRIAREYAYAERGYSAADTLSQTVRAETGNGMAKLYDYAEENCDLTALLCAAFPNDVDKTAVAYSLKYRLTSAFMAEEGFTNDEKASCYLGLAALNQPYLSEIRAFLESEETLTAAEKLKLCTALALLGDRNTALKNYLDITENLVLYQKDGETYAYFSETTTEDSNAIQGDTRLALMAASVLNLPEAEGMARWLSREKRREYACSLELVTFLKNYKPAINMNARAAYLLDGAEQTVKIDSFFGTTLSFGEEQFKNAGFKVLEGQVGVRVGYEGLTEELDGTPSLTVRKTITLKKGTDGEGGALYRVDLEIEGDGKSFLIEDMIPSNARFVYSDTSENGVYVSHDDGQDVTISLYKKKKASYYIRRITKGECVLEGAAAFNAEDDFGIAEKRTF